MVFFQVLSTTKPHDFSYCYAYLSQVNYTLGCTRLIENFDFKRSGPTNLAQGQVGYETIVKF